MQQQPSTTPSALDSSLREGLEGATRNCCRPPNSPKARVFDQRQGLLVHRFLRDCPRLVLISRMKLLSCLVNRNVYPQKGRHAAREIWICNRTGTPSSPKLGAVFDFTPRTWVLKVSSILTETNVLRLTLLGRYLF